MKNSIIMAVLILCGITVAAQEKMYIHKSDKMTLGALISLTDSIYFNEDETISYFRIGDTLAQYPVSEIDSLTFGPDSDTIFITYNATDVTVFNPLAFEGVEVLVEGTDVTVHALTEVQDINFCLAGSTTNGMFKIYTAKRYNLILKGVAITNPDGPAINIQTGKNTTVFLADGTTNTLADGVTYAEPPAGEDQDGTFFSESKLKFNGNGTLVINSHGSAQHGICSDDEIEINGGIIQVYQAARDGIHAREGVLIDGGIISIVSSQDGIDGDEGIIDISGGFITINNNSDDHNGITCDSTMIISGGVLNITVAGDQSKGINCTYPVTLSGGDITVHNTGDAVLVQSGSGYDPSYCTAIKSDSTVEINGSIITIVASGKAGRGISSESDIIMSAGSVTVTSTGNGAVYTNTAGALDAYVATCFNAGGDIRIAGGTVTTSSSGSGGKGLNANGELILGTFDSSPLIQITTTGAKVHISGGGQNSQDAEAKAVSIDTDVVINNGDITIASADDGIKTGNSITINGGDLTISNSYEGLESPFITINGGTVHVYSSDDAINATFGNGGEFDDGSLLSINGGWVMTSASGGDGLDSNGDIHITGGTTVVHGPQSAPEVGMDCNGTCNMDGGFLVISGTNSNMTEAPANSSDQYCVKVMMNQGQSNSTLFHIEDASGYSLLTFQPTRTYYSVIFSSAELQQGQTYSIYTGGTCTGENTDGLYSGGVYSGGTFRKSFTVNSTITNVNF
ncbi:MAG: carbohydrate-binding domain-containing protein [Bacteroidales bacterium]|nr:carbohydrate-binding domain-containing protein [Bacteroidales bacterium]